MREFLQSGDLRIAFEQSGQGPPLLLMHGAEADRRMFASIVPLLAGRFTVIAYDQRDCGDTEGSEASAHATTLADLAHDAASLVRGLGLARAHVFGSSFGGRVAQALALLHPESVDRLALGSTWPLPQTYEAMLPADAARLGELRARLPESAEELAGWFFPESFLQERPELRQLFAAARPGTDRSRRRARTVAGALDLSPSAIEARTLVIAGSLDRVVPAEVTMRLAESIPDAKRVLLECVGHVTVMQAGDAVARHLTEFLLA
jgi:3-oxoadipate enol-lactonase